MCSIQSGFLSKEHSSKATDLQETKYLNMAKYLMQLNPKKK